VRGSPWAVSHAALVAKLTVPKVAVLSAGHVRVAVPGLLVVHGFVRRQHRMPSRVDLSALALVQGLLVLVLPGLGVGALAVPPDELEGVGEAGLGRVGVGLPVGRVQGPHQALLGVRLHVPLGLGAHGAAGLLIHAGREVVCPIIFI